MSLDFKEYHKNPRKITTEDFALLRLTLEKYGDLSGIVLNRRTGELVGGHQRTRIFKDQEASIMIEKMYEKPTKTGTIATGYVEVDGERFAYREVDWDETTAEGANIAANKVGGVWDFDKLANDFELKTLFDNGWKEFELGFMQSNAMGSTDSDPLPGSMTAYLRGTIKQLTFHFDPATYEDILKRLDVVRTEMKVESHTDVFIKLLENYESHRGKKG